jgi:hypothetical protein
MSFVVQWNEIGRSPLVSVSPALSLQSHSYSRPHPHTRTFTHTHTHTHTHKTKTDTIQTHKQTHTEPTRTHANMQAHKHTQPNTQTHTHLSHITLEKAHLKTHQLRMHTTAPSIHPRSLNTPSSLRCLRVCVLRALVGVGRCTNLPHLVTLSTVSDAVVGVRVRARRRLLQSALSHAPSGTHSRRGSGTRVRHVQRGNRPGGQTKSTREGTFPQQHQAQALPAIPQEEESSSLKEAYAHSDRKSHLCCLHIHPLLIIATCSADNARLFVSVSMHQQPGVVSLSQRLWFTLQRASFLSCSPVCSQCTHYLPVSPVYSHHSGCWEVFILSATGLCLRWPGGHEGGILCVRTLVEERVF